MKIVHIAATAPYNDNWGYQDNLLPKYQKKLGHEVTMITTNTKHENGKIVEVEEADYTLDDGVRVIRLKKKKYCCEILTNLHSTLPVYNCLEQIKPDFVFFHGLISSTIFEVIKYKKNCNSNCVIVQDNHMDYNIGYRFDTFKKKLVRAFHRFINKRSISQVEKVYGVTPWRKKYAEDYFKIPTNKTDVLIMGADDEKIDFANREKIRREIREKYNVSENDFLIVTGGKIDKKKKIDVLMSAIEKGSNEKLIIFGEVHNDVKENFYRLLNENSNIIYVGWISADSVYDYFFAADIVLFPGQHSVLWEQACASKVPCVFEEWEGMDHVNNGGNSAFISGITQESIKEMIAQTKFTEKYYKMKEVALSKATDIYLYSAIARKSLETKIKDEEC